MKSIIRLTAAAALLLFGGAAHAGLITFVIDGNDCGGNGYYGNDPCAISEDGQDGGEGLPDVSVLLGKWTSGNDDNPGELSTSDYGSANGFDWNLISFYDDEGELVDGDEWEDIFEENAGSWSYSGSEELIRFWIAKAGDQFVVHFISDGSADCIDKQSFECLNSAIGVTAGSWDLSLQEIKSDLSHITFFNGVGTTTVPEPGTLALFGLGLIGIGIASRRRVA